MEIEKIHNLNDAELAQQGRQAAEQLFRLRFQMRMGQNDGVQKLRGLRKDIARIQTVMRQRELGIVRTRPASSAAPEQAEPVKAARQPAAKKAKAAAPKKAAVARKTTASAKAKPAAAKKPAGARKTPSAKKGSR
jgi:large subunit ribosomal protein L29